MLKEVSELMGLNEQKCLGKVKKKKKFHSNETKAFSRIARNWLESPEGWGKGTESCAKRFGLPLLGIGYLR